MDIESSNELEQDADAIKFEQMLAGEFDKQVNVATEVESIVEDETSSIDLEDGATEDTNEDPDEDVLEDENVSSEDGVLTNSTSDEVEELSSEEVQDEEVPDIEEVVEEDVEIVVDDTVVPTPSVSNEFFDAISSSEIIVNGRRVKASTDIQTIVSSQQKVVDLSDKIDSFSPIRPFAKAIVENFVDDPDKFTFALDLLSGDKEAIKKLIKENNVDPLDLDLDSIKYQPSTSKIETIGSINIADAFNTAKSGGFDTKLSSVLSTWDDESLRNFSESSDLRDSLLDLHRSGSIDTVLDKVADFSASDKVKPMGIAIGDQKYRFKDLTSDNKFRYAIAMINEEQKTLYEKSKQPKVDLPKKEEPKVDTNKAVEQKEVTKKVTSHKRRKATHVSKRKPAPKKKEPIDAMKLEGEEFEAYWKKLERAGI